jgi:hypothetical protein
MRGSLGFPDSELEVHTFMGFEFWSPDKELEVWSPENLRSKRT